MFGGSQETGNVLITTESQGFRKKEDFGPIASETGSTTFGKCTPGPERHFVPESPDASREQKDSRKVHP